MDPEESSLQPRTVWRRVVIRLVWQVWVAHAVCFFAHEYGHSFTAWALGWKSNPLALNYGHKSLAKLLSMGDVDENVDYMPIFSSHHDLQAGIIAAAGAVVGNGLLTYPVSRWISARARKSHRRHLGGFAYWMAVMSVGNFWDYVPVRTFSYREDMHTTEQGFHCSPWAILLLLGVPFGLAMIDFLVNFEPKTITWLYPRSCGARCFFAIATSLGLFGYFGASGLFHSGRISLWISISSIALLFPLTAIWQTRLQRRAATESR